MAFSHFVDCRQTEACRLGLGSTCVDGLDVTVALHRNFAPPRKCGAVWSGSTTPYIYQYIYLFLELSASGVVIARIIPASEQCGCTRYGRVCRGNKYCSASRVQRGGGVEAKC